MPRVIPTMPNWMTKMAYGKQNYEVLKRGGTEAFEFSISEAGQKAVKNANYKIAGAVAGTGAVAGSGIGYAVGSHKGNKAEDTFTRAT